MPDFSDSYCEIEANLPWDFEIYHDILKAKPWNFPWDFFAINVQHFQVFSSPEPKAHKVSL